MARVAILNSALLVLLRVTVTTSLTITATPDVVTVRRGEQLQMSCEIDLDQDGETHTSITAVRWERGSNTPLYEMSITSHCVAVMRCNAITADNRGTVQYVVNDMNSGTLTLTLDSSMLEDNTTFRCAALYKDLPNNNKQKSAPISVTVYYLPNITYPQCKMSKLLSGSIPSVLLCSSEKTQPVVSLEWTAIVSSTRVSLSNDTGTLIAENQVENALHLHSLDTPYNNSVFTCYMTSVAYPGVIRNCSIGPVLIFPTPTPNVTTAVPEVTGRLQNTTLSTETTATTSSTLSIGSTHATGNHEKSSFTHDTTPPPSFLTSFLGTATTPPILTVSLSITVTAAVGGAVGVIILILFIIIACLVASRRKTKRRGHREESALIYESPIAATDHPSNHAGDRYVNVPLETIVHSGPAATPHHHRVPPSGAGGLPLEYAQATPRSHRKPSFEYTVPNQDNLPSQEDVPPPEYAEVTPSSHRQQPQHDYSVANPDNPPSQAGMLPPEYAEVTPRSQRRQPPPEYAMLDPDNPPLKIEDDGYSYAAVQEEKCRASPDGEEKAEQEWSGERPLDGKGEEIQSGGASYPFGEYAEVGQDFKSDSPELECLDMGKITGEISKGEEVVPYFVDNILYVDSSDEALIREQAFVNESLVTSKKKKKGKEKPRLDPF